MSTASPAGKLNRALAPMALSTFPAVAAIGGGAPATVVTTPGVGVTAIRRMAWLAVSATYTLAMPS